MDSLVIGPRTKLDLLVRTPCARAGQKETSWVIIPITASSS